MSGMKRDLATPLDLELRAHGMLREVLFPDEVELICGYQSSSECRN